MYESGREGNMLLTGFSPRKQDLVRQCLSLSQTTADGV